MAKIDMRRRRTSHALRSAYAPPPPPPAPGPSRLRIMREALDAPAETSATPRKSGAPLLNILAVVALAAATVWLGGLWPRMEAASRQAVTETLAEAGFLANIVDVRGASRTSEWDIERRIGAPRGAVITDIDLAAARQNIEEISWVRHAAVMRVLPNRIVVVVDEREPLALWRPDDTAPLAVIDEEGAVIAGVDPAVFGHLPVLEGAGAPEAAESLLAELVDRPRLTSRIAFARRMGERRWDLVLASGAVLKLPEDPLSPTLDFLARVDAGRGLLDLPLAAIDLRHDLVLSERAGPRGRGA